MTNDEIRDILLEHSDHRAVRNVFGERTETGSAAVVDHVETARITGGALAVAATDGTADVYVRWNDRRGRYERLAVWPPWSVSGCEYADRDELVAYLEGTDDIEAMRHEETPFADEEVLSTLSDGIWQ